MLFYKFGRNVDKIKEGLEYLTRQLTLEEEYCEREMEYQAMVALRAVNTKNIAAKERAKASKLREAVEHATE